MTCHWMALLAKISKPIFFFFLQKKKIASNDFELFKEHMRRTKKKLQCTTDQKRSIPDLIKYCMCPSLDLTLSVLSFDDWLSCSFLGSPVHCDVTSNKITNQTRLLSTVNFNMFVFLTKVFIAVWFTPQNQNSV